MNCFSAEWRCGSPALGRAQDDYRGRLQGFLVDVPKSRAIDFRSVVLSADAVHKRTSGQVSPRAFLVSRRSDLNGRSPIEVMGEPDGPERIRRAVDAAVRDFG